MVNSRLHQPNHTFHWLVLLKFILIDEASDQIDYCALQKKECTIQYGYRTLGTHARVFSQTLWHGNSKNEIRQRNR